MYETTIRPDGTVRYWDVYRQQWQERPAAEVGDSILATLPDAERRAILEAAQSALCN